MKTLRSIMSWLVPVAIGLVLALLIKQFVFQLVRVDGPSMQPNLQNNERVACIKTAKIHRGSVIVFNAKGVDPQVATKTDYVKRVIGLSGDTVESKNGKLYVNGKLVNQQYINAEQRGIGTGSWTLASISKQNNWLKNQGRPRCLPVNTSSWGTTAVSPTTVVTGDLCRKRKLTEWSRPVFGTTSNRRRTTLTTSGNTFTNKLKEGAGVQPASLMLSWVDEGGSYHGKQATIKQ